MAILPKTFDEAERHRSDVESELERICASSQFKTSRRSCQFLRYVVRVALDGRADSLKERTIGMDLLCRDVSYDPSSDATVRVRANDVRKRLASFYSSVPPAGSVRIALSTGKYVPDFLPAATTPAGIMASEAFGNGSKSIDNPEIVEVKSPRIQSIHQVSLFVGISLAVVVSLISVLAIRHRFEQRDACLRFWDRVLAGKKVLLLSVSDQDRNRLGPGLFPVVWIAGKFGVPAVLTSGSLTGATTATFAKVRIASVAPTEWTGDKRVHWLLDARQTPTLTSRGPDGHLSSEAARHSALLTILPESPAILYVQSTDDDVLRKLFEVMTLSADFPRTLATSGSSPAQLQVYLSIDPLGRSIVRTWSPGH